MTTPPNAYERRLLLLAAVGARVIEGYRVELTTDVFTVVVKGRPVNQKFHLVLSILTIGLWSFVWIALDIFGGEKRDWLFVDEEGIVHAVDHRDVPRP